MCSHYKRDKHSKDCLVEKKFKSKIYSLRKSCTHTHTHIVSKRIFTYMLAVVTMS